MTVELDGHYQVDSDGSSQQPSTVDINRVVPELDDPGQSSQDGQHDEGEHQQRLQQLSRVCQHCVEVHLKDTAFNVSTSILRNILHRTCVRVCVHVSHSLRCRLQQRQPKLHAGREMTSCTRKDRVFVTLIIMC